MSREDPHFRLRIPAELREEIREAATTNGRSMNAEIVARLSGQQRTLRDEFAMQAMGGYCAVKEGWDETPDEVARAAYAVADAMLRRSGGKP